MESNTENHQCAVLVSSCDAYSDAWQPFFTLFFRYWPDCPFPVYLISNYQRYDDPRVISVLIGEDKKWASNLRVAIDKMAVPHLIYMQEDYFLRSPVDTTYLNKIIDYSDKNKAACVYLFPDFSSGLPDYSMEEIVSGGKGLGLKKISPEAGRGISLQVALWNTDALGKIMRDGESGWDMEERGGKRSKDYLFLTVSKPTVDYLPQTGIVKGKWVVSAIKLCRREGVKIDLSRRPIAYDIEWRSFLDRLRKHDLMRMVRRLPIIGNILARILIFLNSIGRRK